MSLTPPNSLASLPSSDPGIHPDFKKERSSVGVFIEDIDREPSQRSKNINLIVISIIIGLGTFFFSLIVSETFLSIIAFMALRNESIYLKIGLLCFGATLSIAAGSIIGVFSAVILKKYNILEKEMYEKVNIAVENYNAALSKANGVTSTSKHE